MTISTILNHFYQACSTCHLIFKPEDYAKLGEPPTDEELDMLVIVHTDFIPLRNE